MFKRALILCILLLLGILAGILLSSLVFHNLLSKFVPPEKTWVVKSIDTMKYSRDLTVEKLHDPSFDTTIDQQVSKIAQTGATYVAIATPYDPEFVPMLTRWVGAARKYNLNVWFRGNFSGWEGWFGYERITRDQHKALLASFLRTNNSLFKDGDIFTPCPECENGGPGDPRKTGSVAGYRQFLIDEYNESTSIFSGLGKHVSVGFASMNYDVARLVMDRATTRSLGGIVTIDHYVATPQTLIANIRNIARESGGKIFLGEFGVPIPDINVPMTESEQSAWIDQALTLLSHEPEVIGINYWVGFGGSTALWNDDGSPRHAVSVVSSFFSQKE